jgi:hypothetical protein
MRELSVMIGFSYLLGTGKFPVAIRSVVAVGVAIHQQIGAFPQQP